jgi:hypothetical protein
MKADITSDTITVDSRQIPKTVPEKIYIALAQAAQCLVGCRSE